MLNALDLSLLLSLLYEDKSLLDLGILNVVSDEAGVSLNITDLLVFLAQQQLLSSLAQRLR